MIAAPYSRENGWYVSPDDQEALPRLVGRKASQWIEANRDRLGVRCVATRNSFPLQTAFHADWLIFLSPEGTRQFLQAFPNLAIANRIERLEHERRELAAKIEARLARGGFDLAKFPAEQRRNIARRFIGADEKLEELARHVAELRQAESLRPEWEQRIGARGPEA